MKHIIEAWWNEKTFLFVSGFVLGIGLTLVCIPPDQEPKETIYEINAEVNSELDQDIKNFIFEISQKYHLYKIKVTIEEEG